MGRADGHRPRHVGGLLIAEFLALAAALTVIGSAATDRIALAVALIAVTATIVAQGSRTRTGATLRGRRRLRLTDIPGAADADSDLLADREGLVAVFTLGHTGSVVSTAHTTVPDIETWPAMTDAIGPAVRLQVLVQTAGARRWAMLAVRVGGDGIAWEATTLRATLTAAVAKIERRLDREGTIHHRVTGAPLIDLMPTAGSVREARDQLTVGSTSQVTLGLRLPAGMTSDMVVRLTESPDAATWLTWSGHDAMIRVAADSATTLRRVVGRIEATGIATRLDGQHLAGLRATLPIVRVPGSTRQPAPSRSRNHRRHDPTTHQRTATPPGAHSSEAALGTPVTLPPYGAQIGHDRNSDAVFLTIPPDRVEPIRLVVIGGDQAARVITDRATAAGIPVRSGSRNGPAATGPYAPVPIWISVVELPTSAHAATLTAADLVICHVLSADAAGVVAEALGLSARMSAWLTRIEPGMVALIGDGAVRWAMLPDPSGARTDLAGALRT